MAPRPNARAKTLTIGCAVGEGQGARAPIDLPLDAVTQRFGIWA